jgi:hypothetical protein
VATVAGQQVVIEMAAQAGQRGAHRGLGRADAPAGAGDVALLQQGAQRDDAGDTVTLTVEGIGTLSVPVVTGVAPVPLPTGRRRARERP